MRGIDEIWAVFNIVKKNEKEIPEIDMDNLANYLFENQIHQTRKLLTGKTRLIKPEGGQ